MIIHKESDYNILLARMNGELHIVTPVLRDFYYHRKENKLLCANIMFLNGDNYTISISHKDSTNFPLITTNKTITANSKLHKEYCVDLSTLAYVNALTIPTVKNTAIINDTHSQFGSMIDANKIVPLTIWNKVLREYNTELLDVYEKLKYTVMLKPYTSVQNVVNTLADVESEGIFVDKKVLVDKFGEKALRYVNGDFVYSEYNCYTLTNRPSNRFGGINYAALNKHDGTRDFIISRYPTGCLVQIDFEAYHLRLVADYLGIKLPKWESLHTELGKMYFDTDEITEDLYAKSKQKTFEIMYGMSRESYGFELFEKIHNWRELYRNMDEIELPSGMVTQVQSPSASKLFNYYIQSLETVRTIPKLKNIIDLLKNTNNHVILYTYDSVLFDMETFDETLIKKIVSIAEEDDAFPVRVYKGSTYDNIKEIRL